MNRSDKIFTVIVLLVTVVLFLSTSRIAEAINVDKSQAIVRYRDKEILRIDMNRNDFYTVSGTLGDVVIQVEDGRIRIADEISPLHYCSLQGWVDRTNTPIVCLPNGIVVVIESNQNEGEGNDEDIIIR